MNLRFDGKVVVVSGAGHGFGRTIAQTFAGLGAVVHGCDLSAEELAETARHGNIYTRVVDLTDRKAAAAWIHDIEAQSSGRAVFCLVNNAGGVAGQAPRPLDEVPDEDWDRIFAINVGAAMVLSRAAAPAMKKAGHGRIVNISSGAGLQASLTGIQAYCSAKHAVIGLTRQLAHEFGPFGITVNSVAPGFIRTNASTEKQWESYGADGQKALVERIAMKRLGSAEDIANAVIFFASELAGFVNGQVIQVDGGR
ncbi:SDR family NAD(P)-dependent oxidoreductase [Limobrevibacterium gyesilva]|uniref:SDR family oxidoreductase n=1 Tax=Limobrevibacterium gyesilva TaxID=2991712 RepID=A0AA41YP65_9PROT|nr:SDR family NAD(P)-dependent oxidoreductase [Limobrevibacterium gyesilva]MCW3477159.1 SDR family oxidoreductase [Limobrevibacterium gyesilva]